MLGAVLLVLVALTRTYDFNWQLWYDTSIKVPKGTTMMVNAWYDNSVGNKFNPNPNAPVYYGDQTWEEMHFPFYGLVIDDPAIDPRRVVRSSGAPPCAAADYDGGRTRGR